MLVGSPGERVPAATGQAQLSDSQQRPALPPEVQRARQLRRTGLVLSAGAVAVAGAAAIAGGVQIHPPAWLPAAICAPPAATATTLLSAKAVLGAELWIEWHGGRLHVERIPRRTGARMQPGDVEVSSLAQAANTNGVCCNASNHDMTHSVAKSDVFDGSHGRMDEWMTRMSPQLAQLGCQVRATTDGRGNGAFAVRQLPEGMCLGDYEGDVLGEAQYWHRYPSGMVCTLATACHELCLSWRKSSAALWLADIDAFALVSRLHISA